MKAEPQKEPSITKEDEAIIHELNKKIKNIENGSTKSHDWKAKDIHNDKSIKVRHSAQFLLCCSTTACEEAVITRQCLEQHFYIIRNRVDIIPRYRLPIYTNFRGCY